MLTDTPGGGQNWTPMVGHFSMPFDSETVIKEGTIRKISLITSYDDNSQLADMHAKLDELKQSLLEIDVELDISLNPKIHDREIRFNNGWVIKIGRGLDFYQKPGGWYELGATDLSLRKCLETKVDIYRNTKT